MGNKNKSKNTKGRRHKSYKRVIQSMNMTFTSERPPRLDSVSCSLDTDCVPDAFCLVTDNDNTSKSCVCQFTGALLKPRENCTAKDTTSSGVIFIKEIANGPTVSTPSPELTRAHNETVIAVTLSSATCIFLLLALICWLWKRHLTRQGIHSDDVFCLWRRPKLGLGLKTLGKTGVLDSQQFTANPNYYTSPPEMALLKSLLHLEISGDKLVFLDIIGEGCFGKVFKGVFQKNETEVCDVAVKVLKENSSNETQVDFLREVEIMSTFDHPNILALLGVVIIENGVTPWMVFEYMEYGDLAEVLRENSPYFWTNSNVSCKITKGDLPDLAIQIASGMTYLSSQHFVHRDLATRNCLLGKDLVVKISDFGMTRDIYTCDYYKIGGSRMLPVRWMSPESVMYGKFTLESDIWSFGVVLWEIFAYGKQPYYGHSNEEVVKLIRQGILLTPPEDCPHYVCQLMEMCWKTNPYDRIKFPQIYDMLLQKNTNREDPAVHLALDTHNNDPYNTITNGGVCRTIRGTTTTTSASQATTIVMPTTATTGMMTPTVGVSVDSVDDQNYLVPRSATNVVLA